MSKEQKAGWYWTQTQSEEREDRHGRRVIVLTIALRHGGKAFHYLTGPTAPKSMGEFCEFLNANNVEPKELEKEKFE